MVFGASLPADGQRQKAGAAPRLACAPPPNARVRVFRLAKQGRADFDLCHPATHASRTMLHHPATRASRAMLHKLFRFARFQSTNRTILASHLAFLIESSAQQSVTSGTPMRIRAKRECGRFLDLDQGGSSVLEGRQGAHSGRPGRERPDRGRVRPHPRQPQQWIGNPCWDRFLRESGPPI